MSNISLNSYIVLIKYVTISSLLSLLFVIFKDLIIIKELNIITYIKFVLTLFLVSVFTSLIYFLEVSFHKYRILWIIGFLGTVVLSPLLVESGMFVRDLRFKSLLDFWNWIVPYQSVEQLHQFVLFEGWQGWEIALMSAMHLLIYWFVIVSICLYVRQFQLSWKIG
jgi:FlaA1/EpsC-like NDP-sugar epimerase